MRIGFTLLLALAGILVYGQHWDLVWADEFDGTKLDDAKWSFMFGTGSDYGLTNWGNEELQYYRAENAVVADGFLTITAKQESYGGKSYTSARIRTAEKGDWTYGRIEARAKMPKGKGLWPAIWMLPTDNAYGGWANSGEIDIMEYLGDDPTKVHGTIHYGGQWPNNQSTTKSYTLNEGDFCNEFHEFAFEWEEGRMRWYVDGELYSTITSWSASGYPFPAPFNRRFHLLVNLAVGGRWPGNPDASTSFPQELVLDYIRVYEKGSNSALDEQAGEAGFNVHVTPNPINGQGHIQFRLHREGEVNLYLFDGTGRNVATLLAERRAAGVHEIAFEASDFRPGSYFCHLRSGRQTEVCKLLVF
ncbi:MAG: glucan endo-1,3-beta-D-glucosidase [Bacteroidetes bacterium]|nr:MAG: glucan endo-1,3-beta-D-glucosidase [Bacteroidota bacterium]